MHASTVKFKTSQREPSGIVYRTACQNPGCGHTFRVKITPQDASVLSGTMTCPRCKRQGGMLKSMGRVENNLFAAKLIFRNTGLGSAAMSNAEDGDLLSDILGRRN